MNDGLRNRIQRYIDGLRKKASDVGPMHSSWDDIFDLEAMLKDGAWQPIETAPRDGTEILVANEWSPGKWEYFTMWWEDGGWDAGDYDVRGRPVASHWKLIAPPSEPPAGL